MRRLVPLLALLLLLPAPALAQRLGPFNQLGNPSPASTQVSNTGTNTAIASYAIPAGYLSSGRAHLKLLGNISTKASGPGTITVTAVACGTSVTTVDAVTVASNLATQPWSYDLWLSPYGSGTAQQVYLYSDMRYNKTVSTEDMFKSVSRVTCNATINQAVTVSFQWGTSNAANGLQVESAVFSMGQ